MAEICGIPPITLNYNWEPRSVQQKVNTLQLFFANVQNLVSLYFADIDCVLSSVNLLPFGSAEHCECTHISVKLQLCQVHIFVKCCDEMEWNNFARTGMDGSKVVSAVSERVRITISASKQDGVYCLRRYFLLHYHVQGKLIVVGRHGKFCGKFECRECRSWPGHNNVAWAIDSVAHAEIDRTLL